MDEPVTIKPDSRQDVFVEQKKKRGFFKFLFKWLIRLTLGTFSLVVLIAVALYFLTQVDPFRKWTADQIQTIANRELLATVVFKDAVINPLSGIELSDVLLISQGDTLLQTRRLTLSYDWQALAIGAIVVQEVTLDSPRIKIIRGSDSVWNVSRIAKPSNSPNSPTPDITLYVNRLLVTSGRVTIWDSTWSGRTDGRFDPSHTEMFEMNVDLNGLLRLKSRSISATINHLSYSEPSKNHYVDQLALTAHIDSTHTYITDLVYRTPSSSLRADASYDDNLLALNNDSWNQHPFDIRAEFDSVSSADIMYFTPPTVSFSGSFSGESDLRYSPREIDIRSIDLRFGTNRLNGTCRLQHLDGSKPMFMSAAMTETKISYENMRQFIPFVSLPSLPFLHSTSIDSCLVSGRPSDSLAVFFRGTTSAGRFDGDVSLEYGLAPLAYSLDADVKDFNLGLILQDAAYQSSLNGKLLVVGAGTELKTLLGTATIDCKNSFFAEQWFQRLQVVGSIDGKATCKIDTLLLVMSPPDAVSPMSEEEAFFEDFSPEEISASGELDLSIANIPSYKFQIRAKKVNVSRYVGSSSLPQAVTGVIDIRGSGMNPDSMILESNSRFTHFEFGDRSLLPFKASLSIEKNENNDRRVTLKSKLLDGRIEGHFLFGQLIAGLSSQFSLIAKSFDNRLAIATQKKSPDSVAFAPIYPHSNVDASFHFRINDLSMLAGLLGDSVDLRAEGVLAGRFVGDGDGYTIKLDTGNIRSFAFIGPNMYIVSEPITFRGLLQTTDLQTRPIISALNLDLRLDSIMYLGDSKLKDTRILVEYSGDTVELNASSHIDNNKFKVTGRLFFSANDMSFVFDSLLYSMGSNLEWKTQEALTGVVKSDGLHVDNALFHRENAETIRLSGNLSSKGFGDKTRVSVSSFPLRDLQLFAPNSVPLRPLRGLVDSVVLDLAGSFESPVIRARVLAEGITYNSVPIGSSKFSFEHSDSTITGSGYIYELLDKSGVVSEKKTLVVNVKQLPLNLAIGSPPLNRLRVNAPIDISLGATDLSLGVVAPFLPTAVHSVNGVADAEISVTGTSPNSIEYRGLASIKRASMIVTNSDLRYFARGKLKLQNNVVNVDSLFIANDPIDLDRSRAWITGNVTIDDFNIDRFNLKAHVQKLKVLSMSSVVSSPTFFGDVILDPSDFTFDGTLSDPRLRGTANISTCNLVLPEDKSARISSSRFTYEIVESKTEKSVTSDNRLRSFSEFKKRTIDEAEDKNKSVSKSNSYQNFMDILDYDLDLYFAKDFTMTMNFEVYEQLSSKLGLPDPSRPLRFTHKKLDNKYLYGSINVKKGSTYKFYKALDATGTLDFDTGEITNPKLRLNAVYEGSRFVEKTRQTFRVFCDISGTKALPKARFRYELDGNEAVGDEKEIESDALLLLLIGKTQKELVSGGIPTADVAGAGGSSFSTGLVSSAFTDILKNTTIGSGLVDLRFNSVVVDFQNPGDFATANLRLSGTILENVGYDVGGTVGESMVNSQFTITVPASIVFSSPRWLEHVGVVFTTTLSDAPNSTRQQKNLEIKIGYEGGF